MLVEFPSVVSAVACATEIQRGIRERNANIPSFEAFYFYARSTFAQGKIERAAELFERAAVIRPDDYQSPCLLVQIYKSLGRVQDCKTAARKGIELAEREIALYPEDSRPAQLGAGALIELGETERAKEWISRAMAIDPDDYVAQFNAACSDTLLGDVDRALDLLERCLPISVTKSKIGQSTIPTWRRSEIIRITRDYSS